VPAAADCAAGGDVAAAAAAACAGGFSVCEGGRWSPSAAACARARSASLLPPGLERADASVVGACTLVLTAAPPAAPAACAGSWAAAATATGAPCAATRTDTGAPTGAVTGTATGTPAGAAERAEGAAGCAAAGGDAAGAAAAGVCSCSFACAVCVVLGVFGLLPARGVVRLLLSPPPDTTSWLPPVPCGAVVSLSGWPGCPARCCSRSACCCSSLAAARASAPAAAAGGAGAGGSTARGAPDASPAPAPDAVGVTASACRLDASDVLLPCCLLPASLPGAGRLMGSGRLKAACSSGMGCSALGMDGSGGCGDAGHCCCRCGAASDPATGVPVLLAGLLPGWKGCASTALAGSLRPPALAAAAALMALAEPGRDRARAAGDADRDECADGGLMCRGCRGRQGSAPGAACAPGDCVRSASADDEPRRRCCHSAWLACVTVLLGEVPLPASGALIASVRLPGGSSRTAPSARPSAQLATAAAPSWCAACSAACASAACGASALSCDALALGRNSGASAVSAALLDLCWPVSAATAAALPGVCWGASAASAVLPAPTGGVGSGASAVADALTSVRSNDGCA
jgi:hypothetical protein